MESQFAPLTIKILMIGLWSSMISDYFVHFYFTALGATILPNPVRNDKQI